MKSIKFLIASFIILSCTCLSAQSKWFVAPLVGVTTIDNNWGYNANLTLGHYLGYFGKEGKEGRFRADICAGFFNFSDNKIYSAAALFTACDGGTSKWYYSNSLGFGIQKSNNSSKEYDFIIPIRMTLPYTAYRFNDKMCLGLDLGANLNLSLTPLYFRGAHD